MSRSKEFKQDSEKIAFDLNHRNTIRYNMSKYDVAVTDNKLTYKNIDELKQYASSLKEETINHIDKYLIEFEKNFTSRGGKVIWARDGKEAVNEIIALLNKDDKLVVKSKSMTTEEIQFNEALEKCNVESVETDLGEFIVQIAEEPPYHIVTPAMHKSKEDIAELYNEKFNTPEGSSPEFLTEYTRNYLREKFVNADVGVTGANFLIADIGGVAVTENEGNALMSTSFPKKHIVIAGIEKIIPSYKNLGLMWPLLSAHGTGQRLTAYNSIFTGARSKDEIDGPEEMFVVLLDNGRTIILQNHEQRSALKCIRCGACLNYCPIYKNIGGYTYNSVYGGPIGKVINPHLNGLEANAHLSFASTLCGKCTEICPVKIELHKLLVYSRKEIIENTSRSLIEKITMKFLKFFLMRRKLLNLSFFGTKNFFLGIVAKGMWGKRRSMPKFAKKSFSSMWKNK